MSALPPKADIRQRIEHVCFVPKADLRPYGQSSIEELSHQLGFPIAKMLDCLGFEQHGHERGHHDLK